MRSRTYVIDRPGSGEYEVRGHWRIDRIRPCVRINRPRRRKSLCPGRSGLQPLVAAPVAAARLPQGDSAVARGRSASCALIAHWDGAVCGSHLRSEDAGATCGGARADCPLAEEPALATDCRSQWRSDALTDGRRGDPAIRGVGRRLPRGIRQCHTRADADAASPQEAYPHWPAKVLLCQRHSRFGELHVSRGCGGRWRLFGRDVLVCLREHVIACPRPLSSRRVPE